MGYVPVKSRENECPQGSKSPCLHFSLPDAAGTGLGKQCGVYGAINSAEFESEAGSVIWSVKGADLGLNYVVAATERSE